MEEKSKYFCILTVHGTFAGDDGLESELDRRHKLGIQSKNYDDSLDGQEIEDKDAFAARCASYAPRDWWSDDGASLLDRSNKNPLSKNETEANSYVPIEDKNFIRYFKRIWQIQNYQILDRIATQVSFDKEGFETAYIKAKRLLASIGDSCLTNWRSVCCLIGWNEKECSKYIPRRSEKWVFLFKR